REVARERHRDADHDRPAARGPAAGAAGAENQAETGQPAHQVLAHRDQSPPSRSELDVVWPAVAPAMGGLSAMRRRATAVTSSDRLGGIRAISRLTTSAACIESSIPAVSSAGCTVRSSVSTRPSLYTSRLSPGPSRAVPSWYS